MSECVDDVCDDAPYFKLHGIVNLFCWVVRAFGGEVNIFVFNSNAFYRHFPIDDSYDDVFVSWSYGAVYDQEVSLVNAGPFHGIT